MRVPGLVILCLFMAAAGESSAAPRFKHRFHVAPDEIRTLDTRTLAEMIVQRVHRECDLAGPPAAEGGPVGDDSEIVMMVSPETVTSISKHGFLNQHQTLTTQGVYTIPARFEAEQQLAMIRLPYSHKAKELLPKYALLVVRRPDFGVFPLPTRYGSVAVVFKKKVMKRTTWTYADSSDFHFQAGRFNIGGVANPVLTHTGLYRRKPGDKNKCGNYCEAQIWGKLTFEDVDYLMLRDTEPVPAALLESGLPIYRYSSPADASASYARGKLVNPGAVEKKAPAVPSLAVKNHLTDGARASRRDAELAADGPSASVLGELGARPKSAVVVRELTKAVGAEDPWMRSLALYGLSELSWEEFRPRLLQGLKDPDPLVNSQAIALASEHQDDPEVTGFLSGLRRRSVRDLLATSDWLDRLTKPHICE